MEGQTKQRQGTREKKGERERETLGRIFVAWTPEHSVSPPYSGLSCWCKHACVTPSRPSPYFCASRSLKLDISVIQVRVPKTESWILAFSWIQRDRLSGFVRKRNAKKNWVDQHIWKMGVWFPYHFELYIREFSLSIFGRYPCKPEFRVPISPFPVAGC